MARKLLPGEEAVFSQNRPFIELEFDCEGDDTISSRRKVNRGWPKSRPVTAPSEDVKLEGTGTDDGWF
jgi:hypothetical protein